MRQLTWVSGSFSAHVLAARLASEGIDVQLRGGPGGPYGLTVGAMARVDLWVPEDQLDDARLVLLAAEVDDALAAPREWAGPSERARRRWPKWTAGVLLLAAAVAPLAAYTAD
jgi:Putative prokaryotic signal transducing protein